MQYRKKPVVIRAFQHFGDIGTRTALIPFWVIEACRNGTIYAKGERTFIKTLEGGLACLGRRLDY